MTINDQINVEVSLVAMVMQFARTVLLANRSMLEQVLKT